jgi:hypothetical protein
MFVVGAIIGEGAAQNKGAKLLDAVLTSPATADRSIRGL